MSPTISDMHRWYATVEPSWNEFEVSRPVEWYEQLLEGSIGSGLAEGAARGISSGKAIATLYGTLSRLP